MTNIDLMDNYLQHYPMKKFLMLSARDQNKILYTEYAVTSKADKSLIRMNKGTCLQKHNAKFAKSIRHGSTATAPIKGLNDESARLSKSEGSNPSGGHAPQSHNLSFPRAPGGSGNPTTYKLTEEVLEDAIVRVLQTDPAKGLGPAISFMDKKKSLSVEDADTDRSIIALEKLERKRKEMFYTEWLLHVGKGALSPDTVPYRHWIGYGWALPSLLWPLLFHDGYYAEAVATGRVSQYDSV